MDWMQTKDMILMGMAGGVMYYAKMLVASVQELNVKMAVVIEKLETHDERIRKLEEK